jgi:hypothetical protein
MSTIAVNHVTRSGSKPLGQHGVLPDDTVATAAAKLETLLGGPVYMWCERPVDAHEALAIAVAGSYHETGRTFVASSVVRELKERLGISLTAARVSTPLKTLAALAKIGDIREPVAMRNRYIVPGGYYANDAANPYENDSSDRDFAAGHSRPFNTGDALVESFYADGFMVTTRADLEDARPKGVPAAQWTAGVVDKYFPDVQDRDLFKFSPQAERQLRDQRRTEYAAEPVITYIPMTGGMPVGTPPGPDRLIAAFAALATSESRPVVRIQGGGIDRPVSRIHDSFDEENVRRMRPPSKKEWLQVVFRLGKGSANIIVFPSGSYKLQIRFGYLEKARMRDAVPYLELANAVLEQVSPLIRPLREAYLRPSSSLYIQKPQLLDTPSVLGGPNNGIYQVVAVDLPARCTIEDIAAVVGARGYPSLKGINHHAGSFFMQWTRTNALRKASVVKNLIYHAAAHGGLGAARMEELTSELGLSKKDIADIADSKFDRHSVMTLVRAHLSSDAKLTVSVNGNDPEYGRRIGEALSNVLRECGKGRSKGVRDWSSSVSDSPEAFAAPIASGGDLDEFYEFFDEDDGGEADEYRDDQKPSASSPDALAPLKQKGDILERLKDADPRVFAFPGQPGYVPYSMKCQKNNKTTRQPLVLTDAELRKAESGSTADALKNKLDYRGNTYVCPEKWCPVSGVARRLGEPCPDPDEPEWTMWNNNFPAFQPGVAHPEGLCMPCCFGTKVKPGGKKWKDMQNCLKTGKDARGEADGEAEDGEAEDGEAYGEADGEDNSVKRVKAGHVNKADKLLDEGGFGKVPEDLYPASTPGPAPVRRGMGNKSRATLANTAAFVLGHKSAPALLRKIGAALAPEHFIQCDVREFMDDASVAEDVTEAAVKKWMTPAYASIVGVKGKLKKHQVRREARVMLAHRKCCEMLARGEAPGNASLLRLINSGALGDAAPPVVLVELDENGNAHAEHACERAMPESGRVAVVFKRRSSFEPLGFKHKKTFSPDWDAAHPWVQGVFASVRAQTPSHPARVASYSMMAIGCVTKSGKYLPFARPVFVDPAYKHVHVADAPLPGPASDAEAKAAFALTKNRFYASTWKQVAEATRKDAEKDEALFSAPEEDFRSRTVRELAEKLDAARGLALRIGDDLADTMRRPKETSRQHVKRLRLAAKAIVAEEDADPDDLDYAVERIVHPIPAGVVPSVKTHARERIVYF